MKLLENGVETILFDKDGTLVDLPSIWLPWIEDIEKYLMEALSNYSYNLRDLKHLFGVSRQDGSIDPKSPLAIGSIEESIVIIAFLLYQNGVPWDEAVIYARKSVDFADERQNHSTSLHLVTGVENLLTRLSKEDIKLGVLTSDNTTKAWEQLSRLNISKYFDFVVGSDLVKRSKPFPDLAYAARDQYGVRLKHAVVIGDTNADIQLGKQAGVRLTVGIASYTKNEITHLSEADWIIQSYDELLVTS